MPVPSCNAPIVPALPAESLAHAPADAPLETLREIVKRYRTPTYAYDLDTIRRQIDRLKDRLPAAVQVLYSLKANASLGLCGFMADCGLGADVASAGELVIARAAGFTAQNILVSGPDKSPAVLEQLRSVPDAIVSVDSISELEMLARQRLPHRALLRLRPDFRCTAVCSAGPDSRFGLQMGDLPRCREFLGTRGVRVVGFHIFAGSQVLDAAAIVHHLENAVDQAFRAAAALGIRPEVIDIGGGFGVPYGPDELELELAPIGDALQTLVQRATPARLVMELGRYLVAQAGWYLTTVLAKQTHAGRPAVVVDGGTHQRGDSCGIGLRRKVFPIDLADPDAADRGLASRDGSLVPTDVLGCLSHPGDVLVESAPLPRLEPGDLLAFPSAGAYTLLASSVLFHGHMPPAELAFAGNTIEVMRAREPVTAVVHNQTRLHQFRRSG